MQYADAARAALGDLFLNIGAARFKKQTAVVIDEKVALATHGNIRDTCIDESATSISLKHLSSRTYA